MVVVALTMFKRFINAHLHREHISLLIHQHRLATACLLGSIMIIVGITANWVHSPDTSLTTHHSHELRVVTRISPSTYYLDNASETNDNDIKANGFDYNLLKLFADKHNLELKIQTVDSLDQMQSMVQKGKADLAVPGISLNADNFHLSKSIPYHHSELIVVYKAGLKKPRGPKDLLNKNLMVISESASASHLHGLQEELPSLQWRELELINHADLLEHVQRELIDFAIIDKSEFSLLSGLYPGVKEGFTLNTNQPFYWLFSEQTTKLVSAVNDFLLDAQADSTLAKLEEQFFGYSSKLSQVTSYEFAKNIKKRLPEHLENIKSTADRYGMDWCMLAAISYQESGWNPKAKSPTGVRGMMMLTLATANELGVANRLNVKESLDGGARYYLQLKNRLPKRIQEPDRSWLALAAYNVGMGHLEDARVLTEHRGGDPDSWYDVKQALPLLTDPEWYAYTKYGFARGNEPVEYVQRIRHYYNILKWHETSDKFKSNESNSLATLTSATVAKNTESISEKIQENPAL